MMIRTASIEDAAEISRVESLCFPEKEACSLDNFKERLSVYPNHFHVLVCNGKIISFVNGFVTDMEDLTDDMFSNPTMHNESGKWQMIFGVATLPDFQRKGYATELLAYTIQKAIEEHRKGIVLTCKKEKIHFYEAAGFKLEHLSVSNHGGAEWFQMRYQIKNEESQP